LQASLGAGTEVTAIDGYSLLISGPADPTTLATVSRWCEQQGVLPESLNLGQRNLEDVFLELTGRGLTG
jgi:ABC-2 type transport system ATP-binding protein